VESTDLVPLDGDVAKINRRAEEFKGLHDSLQRNLHTYLPLAMDAIAGVYQKLKVSSNTLDASRQMVWANSLCVLT
jgi:nuclear pore complex protein Nup93